MARLFQKRNVVIYEIEAGVEFNVGTMPNVTIGTMPNVTIASMPNVTISSMPNVTIGTMPSVTIGTMPNVTVGSGTITVDGGDINIASKYNMAKWGTSSFTLGGASTSAGAFVSMLDDDITTYFSMSTVAGGAITNYVHWDLGESRTIKTLLIYLSVLDNGGDGSHTTYLEGSANDSDWTTIDSTTVSSGAGQGTYDNLLGTTETYRYFRVRLVQAGTNKIHTLYIYDAQLIL